MGDLDELARHDVVDQMRIDRRADGRFPALMSARKLNRAVEVVTLRKALALHQPVPFEHRVRKQEAVGGDEIDLRDIGPAGEQGLQHARGGRLADRHRAADADDVGHLGVLGAEEALLRDEQPLGCRHVHRQQPRQRQVDVLHLGDVEPVVERAQLGDLARLERHRRVGAQRRPLGACKRPIGRELRFGTLVHGTPESIVGA